MSRQGIRDETGIGSKAKMYSMALTVPGTKGNRSEKKFLHNFRTCKDYLKTYYLLDTAKSEAKSLLPYFNMGQAILGGYMHATCINLMKAFITLWRSEFKDLDAGIGNHIIPAHIWRPTSGKRSLGASCLCKIDPKYQYGLCNFYRGSLGFLGVCTSYCMYLLDIPPDPLRIARYGQWREVSARAHGSNRVRRCGLKHPRPMDFVSFQ
jgi:hypothetical protein